jgi:cytochrome bd ubiquinol oxidase subunit II
MLVVVIGFLVISLLFYCLLGGADFGAGALELFVPQKNRKRHEELVTKAMGPVWEANHIWLIILIVILFNAFPKVYTQYSIYFHIPLTLMLIGIVLRGCAFSFRQYDALKDNAHRYYTLAFSFQVY